MNTIYPKLLLTTPPGTSNSDLSIIASWANCGCSIQGNIPFPYSTAIAGCVICLLLANSRLYFLLPSHTQSIIECMEYNYSVRRQNSTAGVSLYYLLAEPCDPAAATPYRSIFLAHKQTSSHPPPMATME